ncbi:MAG: hypothetical protein AAF363_10400 [Bacteroidota bacterium]
MKTILSILFIAVVGVASASTTEKSSVKVVSAGNDFKVVFKPTEKESVRVRIADENNATVHTQFIKNTEGFILPVKFADVEDGNYTLEIVTSTEVLTETLSLSTTESVAINMADFIKLNTVTGDKVVSLKSFADNGEDVNVVIYDNKDNAIFNETLNTGKSFERVYRLDEVKSSSVEFAVYHKGNLIKNERVEL